MDGDSLIGVLSEKILLDRAIKGNAFGETAGGICDLDFCVVHHHTELAVLTELFARFKVALVYGTDGKLETIITRIDLIEHLTRSEERPK